MDEQLTLFYEKAVQRAKEMVYKDMYQYFITTESLPTYQQYITDRKHYIEQIWLNSWLNSTVSHVSYSDKKQFLIKKGYEVEGISKKLINQMFRNELRELEPYDLFEWLRTKFAHHPNEWKEKYNDAKEAYHAQQLLNKQREEQRNLKLEFEKLLDDIIDLKYEEMFLYARFLLGSRLAIDIDRYGYILEGENLTLETFLENQMISSRHYHKQQNLFEKYETEVINNVYDFAPNLIKENIPVQLQNKYQLTDSFIKQGYYNVFIEIALSIFEELLDEIIFDLIKLIDIPYHFDEHREIYHNDIMKREQVAREEKEARKRQHELENKIIDDIFGREYNPPPGRNMRYILHVGETNTGKTYHAIQQMKKASSGIYFAPLRLLALEIYETLNEDGIPCSLKTGEEEKLIQGASHYSCTVEMFREKDYYDVIVIDEAQMLADKDRGFSWYKAITKANAKEVHIICSINARDMILQLLGDTQVSIHEYEREIPLKVETQAFNMNHIRKGDALVCFSRKKVLEIASEIQRNGRKVSMIYGSMPPETRKKQMQQFINGETNIIVSTDAIGMGLNLPIQRIVFLENDKFDGTRRRFLTSQEVKQIAGRAGRKGIYNVGKVAFTNHLKHMAKLLQQEDEPLHGFAIAPTPTVLEKFQKYSHKLGYFFYLWDKFRSPKGTKKASLSEEMLLYEMVEDTIIEAKLSVSDLYHFLHLPFSSNESSLREQWRQKLESIVNGDELPEPRIKESGLEDLELSYKSIGLHLLFLYKLDKKTEAIYWERLREDISDKIHNLLKAGVNIKKKSCKVCGRHLPKTFRHQLCDNCHFTRNSLNKQ
ncbi:DEAD/DEAH box helicase [Metabacillus malikii]|uniref:ATP-dependent RNA helicase SUPV3L1/SUV3 n=1 Tax=Metabacillus malikii TaxID=1504265 RepID=A0ABT9ZCH9_9BACI|nr:DEAD/DEAH box helicase [Metabacillus malikii]MDQ0229975.1 ATP-dependent RNA helicase SUPV3L1/SUV3 [Metabacillus malikii]